MIKILALTSRSRRGSPFNPAMAFSVRNMSTITNGNLTKVEQPGESSVQGSPKGILENNNTEGTSNCSGPVTQQSYLSRVPFPNSPTDLTIIPETDTEALGHQIAGHARTGVLKHRLGYVLKSVQKQPLGQREVEFYQKVYSVDNWTHSALRQFIPKFYGVTKIESRGEDGSSVLKEYLILDDMVQGFKKPSIVDVKIGVKTWDPLASEAKIEHERKKYAGTKTPFGISVTGMQFHDVIEKRSIKLDNEYGKHLSAETIHQALKDFLNEKAGAHRYIAKQLLEKLNRLKVFFESQTDYSFFASSLLIAYDADRVEKLLKTTNNFLDDAGHSRVGVSLNPEDEWIRVKMIDFAHVFPSNGELDENYAFGLGHLIQIISTIAH